MNRIIVFLIFFVFIHMNAWEKQETIITESKVLPTKDYKESFFRVKSRIDVEKQQPCRLAKHLAGNLPETVCQIVDRIKHVYKSKFPNASLLNGPPGTGKSTLVQAIANETGAEFISKSASEIITPYQGSGSVNLQALFDEAEEKTNKGKYVILFIDEVDAIGKDRENTLHEERSATLNQLLTLISSRKRNPRLFVFIATNKSEQLDNALRSRFIQIDLELPNKDKCEEIFEFHMAYFPHEEIKKNLLEFAQRSHENNLSGRDIEMVVNQAIYLCERAGAGMLVKEAVDKFLNEMIEKKLKEKKDYEELQKKRKLQIEKMPGNEFRDGIHSAYEIVMIAASLPTILRGAQVVCNYFFGGR